MSVAVGDAVGDAVPGDSVRDHGGPVVDGVAGTRWDKARVAVTVGVLAVLVALTALVVGAPGSGGPPLAPSSTAPDGTKALVLLLRALGAQVTTGPTLPPPASPAGGDVALVLADQLSRADRSNLLGWVDAGGLLVVADPGSGLAGVAQDTTPRDVNPLQLSPLIDGSGCAIPALRSAGRVKPDGDLLLRAEPGSVGCFGLGGGYLLVARDQGRGTVVVVGGPSMWINANLGDAGNSVLAADLLAPEAGTRVTFIGASRVGGGNQGLLSLISPRVIEALWGLALAFVIAALWRARRLGRPVAEELPVELPGSGLVEATGNLMQESRQRAHATSILRADLKRSIADRLGADPRLGNREIAEIAAQRTGVPIESLEEALGGPPPPDDAALVVLARNVAAIRQEILDAR